MRSPATLTAVALLALTAAVVPAQAAGGPEEPQTPRSFFLTVSGSESTWVRGLLLTCAPAPGGHPEATDACAALDRANGDFDTLAGNPRPCTKEYEPVTVSAWGSWRGLPTAWRKTYPNACVLDSATGPVFRF